MNRHLTLVSQHKPFPTFANQIVAPCPQPFIVALVNHVLVFLGKDPIVVIMC